MEKIRVQTTQNVIIEYELASLGDRILATLIDNLTITGLAIIVYFSLGQYYSNPFYAFIFAYLTYNFLSWIYHLLCEIFMNGQTVGKRARNIKVIKVDGTQATISSYILRWIIRPVDISMTFGSVALLFIILTKKGQRIGDLAAGTTVVKRKDRATISERELPQLDENYKPTFPEVTNLHDGDIEIIREVIHTFNKNYRMESVDLMAAKMKEVLNIKSDLSSYAFLDLLVKDYVYYTRGVF